MAAAPALARSIGVLALAGTLAACGGKKEQPPKPTPTVGVVAIRQQPVAIVTELQGRTNAFITSEVRPQVSGIVQARLFREGSLVRRGQPLYRIDPASYRASLAEAQATQQSAEANRVTAQLKDRRYQTLVGMNAVSRQDADDARATAGQAAAAVGQAAAQVQQARINLRYTNVNGRSTYTVGALVTASQTAPLATIAQLDPIYVDIQQSATDLVQLKRELASGGAVPTSAPVRLKLEDGGDYGREGRLEFSEVTVDTSTGSVTLRARFPNPDGLLLPGMFVRAVIQQATRPDGILVPQTGVSRSARGDASVLVVGPGNKVVSRPITTVGTNGTNWIVTGGLKPGDRVIVEGSQNARPGQVVKPVEASTVTGGIAPAASANSARPLSETEKKQVGGGKAKGAGGN